MGADVTGEGGRASRTTRSAEAMILASLLKAVKARYGLCVRCEMIVFLGVLVY